MTTGKTFRAHFTGRTVRIQHCLARLDNALKWLHSYCYHFSWSVHRHTDIAPIPLQTHKPHKSVWYNLWFISTKLLRRNSVKPSRNSSFLARKSLIRPNATSKLFSPTFALVFPGANTSCMFYLVGSFLHRNSILCFNLFICTDMSR